MNKKIIIIILAIVIGAFGLMWWGRQNVPSEPSAGTTGDGTPILTVSEQLYDFGTISMARGKVDHRFTINNPSANDVTVEDVTTSCMCTSAYLENGAVRKGPFGMPGMGTFPAANEMIKAGGAAVVDVVFDPAAHGPAGVGAIDRFVYLREASGATLALEVKAVVVP